MNKLTVGQKIILPLIFVIGMLAMMLALEYLNDGDIFIAEQMAMAAFHLFALAGIVSLIVCASGGMAYIYFRYYRKSGQIFLLASLGGLSSLAYLVDSLGIGAGNMIWGDMTGSFRLALDHPGAVWILSNSVGWAAAMALVVWLGFIYWLRKLSKMPA